MQSFKYSVPNAPRPPRGPRPSRRWLSWPLTAVLVAALGGAAATWGGPVAQSVSGSAGWLLGNPASAGVALHEVEGFLEDGEARLKRGDAKGAVERFDTALRSDPTNLQAYRRALDARYLAGAPVASSADLLPDAAQRLEFSLARGAAELAAGRTDSAIAIYEEAAALAPRDPRALIGQAEVRLKREEYPEAIAAYQAARQLAPDDMSLASALIALRYKLGDYDGGVREAIATFEPLAAKTDQHEVHVGLIEAAVRKGATPAEVRARHHRAAPQLAAADLQLYVAEAYVRHYMSNPNWHKASYDRAVAACKAVLASKPDAEDRTEANRQLARIYAARAQRHYDRSEFDAARAELGKALALQRYLGDDRRLVADLYVQQAHLQAVTGKAQALVRGLEAALAVDPSHPVRAEVARLYANEGLGLLSIGKASDAIRPLQRAVALSPQDSKLFMRLYQALVRANRPQPLASCGKAAGIADAGDRYVQLTRGFLRHGMREDARKVVGYAGRASLSAGAMARLKAELAAADGQIGQARKLLKQALAKKSEAAGWAQLGALEVAQAEREPAHRTARLLAAQAAFRRALAHEADRETRGKLLGVHRALAEHALAHKDYAGAVRHASAALVLAPHNPWLGLALGSAQLKLGQYAEAARALTAALPGITAPHHPAHALLRLRHGQALRAEKRYAEAIETLRAALAEEVQAMPGRSAELYYELAFTLAENGQREEALNAVRQYVFWSQHDPLQGERVEKIQALELELVAQRG